MPTPRCFDAKPKESWGLKPFCPAWPTYALPAEPSSLLSDAVRRALRPFAAGVWDVDVVGLSEALRQRFNASHGRERRAG